MTSSPKELGAAPMQQANRRGSGRMQQIPKTTLKVVSDKKKRKEKKGNLSSYSPIFCDMTKTD